MTLCSPPWTIPCERKRQLDAVYNVVMTLYTRSVDYGMRWHAISVLAAALPVARSASYSDTSRPYPLAHTGCVSLFGDCSGDKTTMTDSEIYTTS